MLNSIIFSTNCDLSGARLATNGLWPFAMAGLKVRNCQLKRKKMRKSNLNLEEIRHSDWASVTTM